MMFEYLTDNITQGSLYALAGRRDDVCTLDFREGSEIYKLFGPKVTVEFVYTQEERRKLDTDLTILDDNPNVKAKGLGFFFGKGRDKADYLLTTGIPIKDIVSVFVLHYTSDNNTFGNIGKRSFNQTEVPFKAYGGGKDIGWVYGFMCRRKKDGIGFMPDYEDRYTAYRFILDRGTMSEEERQKVIDKDGHVVMSNVGYHYLKWREEAGLLEEEEKKLLIELKRRRAHERLDVLKDELKKVGISFNLFRGNYKSQAMFFLKKLFTFYDRSFNILGKHPLYMDYRSFVHIYMRHVEDVNMGAQLAKKDKFQLYEEDVMNMIDHVMHELENDYQQFRNANPDRKYRRTGSKAFYCLGDYYEVFVDKNGRLESFYKASRNALG